MHRSTARWTTAIATAALLALPVAGAAQTTGTTPQQPPTTTPQPQPQPQDPTPPSPTPTQQPPATASQPPAASGQVDANAAKKHLSDARESLAQITSMPEAAKLQGDARTQVSQLISNFNELITTQAEWRASYAKVDANLTTLIGPESTDPTATATTPVGTSGSGVADLDPAIRTKLAEFRSHLNLFEKAAGGPGAAAEAPAAASGTMAPTPATGSTTSPANPATPANPDPSNPNPASPTQPPSSAGATGTSGVTPSSPTGSMAPADQAKAASDVNQAAVREHLDAISDILNKSKTGALTKAQTTELKKHVDQLRTLIKQ
jgi:Meckel syndrome type 1 protein